MLEQLQQAGVTPQDVLIFGGAVVVALVLVVLAFATGANQSKQRLKRVAQLAQKVEASGKSSAVSVKRATADSSIAAVDYIIKRWLPNPQKMRGRLLRTGRQISLGQYLTFCFILAVLVAAVLKLLIAAPFVACLGVGIVVGVGVPHLVIGIMGGRRRNKFNALFPEGIDLIVRGLKSGLPVSESIRVVGQEISDPVGVEFREVSDQIKFGKTLTDAMWSVAPRIDTPEFRFFIIALSIQQETGGNLAETLENLSGVLRKRKTLKLKIKALSSEAKASAYIIGSLPFLMFGILLMMNYGYASTLYTDPRGIILVGCGFISYAMGIGVMAKMVRFDV
ncbi:MAG TPA: type II secretion system F family protein [Candidatus Acidoferrum sp.]|nr:type II secretion system F family protein [Candidatus Acidoferrum sp.]